MGIRHLTYLDLSPTQRREAANKAREQLRHYLHNPFITPDQLAHIQSKLTHLDNWESGKLKVGAKAPQPPVPQAPKHHAVAVADGVKVNTKIG